MPSMTLTCIACGAQVVIKADTGEDLAYRLDKVPQGRLPGTYKFKCPHCLRKARLEKKKR